MTTVKDIKKDLRKKKRAGTQKQLAEYLGVTEGYVSQILSGQKPISKHLETKFRKYINGNK